jgi:hypothetical protein
MGGSTPQVQAAPKTPKENDPSIEAALEKERLMRQRMAGRASTLLSGNNSSSLKTKLGG